jgi:hypothetical protein
VGYATISHVEALNALRTFTATSRPNASQVTGYLEETAGVLDGILAARGFQLPVPTTATSALRLLEHYNAIGAHAFAERAAESSPHKEAAEKLWADAQKMLKDGIVEPSDLPRATATNRARVVSQASRIFCIDQEL